MAAYVRKDAAYQEALLAKRIEFVRRLKADLGEANSVAAQTVAAYTELIDGADTAFQLVVCKRYDDVVKGSFSGCTGCRRAHNGCCCGGASQREDWPGARLLLQLCKLSCSALRWLRLVVTELT